MAHVVFFNWKGVTRDEYDKVCDIAGVFDDPPEGLIAHLAAFDDEGTLRIVDVWESPERFQEEISAKIMPATQEVGLGDRGEPQVEILEIHRAMAPGMTPAGASAS